MVVAKTGFNEPMIGQTIYVVMKEGKPVGATLRYPSVVRAMGQERVDDFAEVPWLG